MAFSHSSPVGLSPRSESTCRTVPRALVRDLNIGVIGGRITSGRNAHRTSSRHRLGDCSTTIDAIRFQATTHQFTDGSSPVNHPKNYLGYSLALAANGDTDDIYVNHVINSISDGRRGVILLGLIDTQPSGDTPTYLGAETVRFSQNQHGSLVAEFDKFAS